MGISVYCPGCSKSFKGKDELAGKRFKCPACGHAIVIPTSGDFHSGPTKKSAGKQGWPWVVGWGVAILCLVVGFVFIFAMWGKNRTYDKTKVAAVRQPEPKSEPKSEQKSEPKSEQKSEPKPEPQPLNPDAAIAPKEDPKKNQRPTILGTWRCLDIENKEKVLENAVFLRFDEDGTGIIRIGFAATHFKSFKYKYDVQTGTFTTSDYAVGKGTLKEDGTLTVDVDVSFIEFGSSPLKTLTVSGKGLFRK